MRASPPPNVVGYLLAEARAVLAGAGWDTIEVTETRPPRRALREPFRVLRQRAGLDGVSLVISGERAADGEADSGASGPAARAEDTALADDGLARGGSEDAPA
ncbi:MAG TPA: hypothetical protein VGZ23_06405 [bacterium]|nr:hypothetical protein [bacterium]